MQCRRRGDARQPLMALMPLGALCVFAMGLLPDPAPPGAGFFTSPGISPNQQFPHGAELAAFHRALPEIPIVEEFPAAETPAPQTAANPPLPRPHSTAWQFVEVRPGDTLSELFAELDLDPVDLSLLLRSGEQAAALNRMKVGYELGFKLDGNGRLDAFRLLRSPFDELAFTRAGEGFHIEPIRHIPRIETGIKGGTVHSSLYAAAQRHEVSPNQSMRMVDIFGGKIDFMLDTQPGDQFTILYEEQYIEDRYVGEGDILVARFVNRGEEHLAVRYESLNGWVGFYSPDGDNMPNRDDAQSARCVPHQLRFQSAPDASHPQHHPPPHRHRLRGADRDAGPRHWRRQRHPGFPPWFLRQYRHHRPCRRP